MKEFYNIQNGKKKTEKVFWVLTLIFVLLMLAPFFEGNFLTDAWPIAFTGIFLSIVFLITALIFRGRARKMNRLLSGEKLLLSWTLDNDSHIQYAAFQKSEMKKKNRAIMTLIGILFVIITIPFLVCLEEDEMVVFLSIIGGVVLIVFSASVFFPWYYFRQNVKGDRQILIGQKYAYINGIFHNWDYPLSGLTKAKVIKKPFYGLNLTYYYTDRTWKHSQEILIPAPRDFELQKLVNQLKMYNGNW